MALQVDALGHMGVLRIGNVCGTIDLRRPG